MVSRSNDDLPWIASMNDLFHKVFGDDFLSYEWDKGLKRIVIAPECFPVYQYDHGLWEKMIPSILTSFASCLGQQQSPVTSPENCLNNISTNSSSGLNSSSPMSSSTNSAPSQTVDDSSSTALPSTLFMSSSPSPASNSTNVNCSPTFSQTVDDSSSTVLPSSPFMSSATNHASHPANANCSSTSSDTAVAKVGFDPGSSVFLFFNDFRFCATSNGTRGQLATLNLPPVMPIADDDIQLVVNPLRLNNPLQLPVRPSESAVSKGYRLVNEATDEESDDEDIEAAVKFGDLGIFDVNTLDIWTKASKAATIKLKVQEEENWLRSTSSTLTPHQIDEIKAMLFESRPQQVILQIGDMLVDAEDLSTLAAERYLNGFVIDGACLKYSDEAMSRNSRTLYLPSCTQTWASSNNLRFLKSKLKPFLSGRDLSNIIWILTPIHVNGNHWGLLCLNMVQQVPFYDDGLKQNPPINIALIVENLLNAVSSNSKTKWNIPTPIERFGMPRQPLFGEGCASCGVAVVLAAYDFIFNPDAGIPKFQWHFRDMGNHRQRLLYNFSQWR